MIVPMFAERSQDKPGAHLCARVVATSVELVFTLLPLAGVSVVGSIVRKRSDELLNKQLESRRRRCLLAGDP